MAIIDDPDDLNQGVEVTIDTSLKEFTLNIAGNLSDDGATGQALYSFFKEEWRTDPLLIPYDFPAISITPEQFEFIEDWTPSNEQTRTLLRTAGWREITAAGDIKREYTGIVSLGNIDAADTAYYAFDSDVSKTDFDFSGPVNQGIQTFGDSANGNFDKRSETLALFIRTQGKTYGLSTTTDIGVSGITYITYRFPLNEGDDLKITATDLQIQNDAPFTGMAIRLFPSPQQRDIGGTDYDFGVIIEGNGGTAEQIYEFVQYQLRQNVDIDPDAGPDIIGSLLDQLLIFEGDTLKTQVINNTDGGGGGVYIDNFNANDTNRIVFADNTGAELQFPFVASGQINFNTNLQNDPDAVFALFFADTFGTAGAIIVEDNDGNPISGNVGGNASLAFTFDYDGNTQGGRVAGTDAPIIAVALGEEDAQYVQNQGLIVRASGQTLALVSALERNYSNP
jgi:hypothetical protein